MKPEELARAVERLSGFNVYARDHIHCALNIPLDKPLAALIEAAATPSHCADEGDTCHFCGARYTHDRHYNPYVVHAPDCALVALVRAINGEGER